jgi:RNA polymerase sigma-70 factor (ECF subfamily)
VSTQTEPDAARADLLERVAAREESAMTELYRRFASVVRTVARQVTASPEAADEVTQEVFLGVWEHPERFDRTRGSVRAWLTTLAHHRAVDWLRSETADRLRREKAAGLETDAGDGVEEIALLRALGERVRAAIDVLPAAQRAALRLAYFGGRTYRQVARELGISEGTAKSRLRLALRRVREVLAPDIDESDLAVSGS